MTDQPRLTGMIHPADILVAFSLLSRLPVPLAPETAANRSAKAVWAYPIVGAVLALIAGSVGYLLSVFGVAAGSICIVMLILLALLTGGLHEDGLADTADGLFGGRNKNHALEIMRDSRVGAYGVTALILILGLRWSSMTDLLSQDALLPVLITAHMISRALMGCAMALIPPARTDGLSALTGAPPIALAGLGLALAILLGAICVGLSVLSLMLGAALFAASLLWLAKRKLDGQTGDILGATQQISESAILVLATALLI